MKNKKIGHIILEGGSIEDLQKEIADFPSKPTIEYFTKLGYKESTAKRYLRYLEKNAKQDTVNNQSNNALANMSEETYQPQNSTEANIIKSNYANCDNILVDTCALAFPECLTIIEHAKQVTFIYSILEEMDKKQYQELLSKKLGNSSTNQVQLLARNIRVYTTKILEFPDKYMVSRFSGYNDEKYVDNILLQYLKILPRQIRPTLLTADKNLATKARSFDFDYIIKMPNNQVDSSNQVYSSNQIEPNNQVEPNVPGKKSKKHKSRHIFRELGYGINLYKDGNKLYINYTGPNRIEILHSGQKISYISGCNFLVEDGDYICLYIEENNNIYEHCIQI